MNKHDPYERTRRRARDGQVNPAIVKARERGRRCADAHNLALSEGHIGRYLAIRMSDGGSDGEIYATKADAERFTIHPTQCYFLKVLPGMLAVDEAVTLLNTIEDLYDAGYRTTSELDALLCSRKSLWQTSPMNPQIWSP